MALAECKGAFQLTDKSRTNPAIDPTFFPATPSSWFWSSSPSAGYSFSAWFVYFSGGYVGGSYRYGSLHVRLVRAGQ